MAHQTLPELSTSKYVDVLNNNRIVSLWDMLQFESEGLLSAMSYIGAMISEYKIHARLRSQGHQLVLVQDINDKAHLIKSIETIVAFSEANRLKVSAKLAARTRKNILDLITRNQGTGSEIFVSISSELAALLNCFITETSQQKFFAMPDTSDEFHQSADDLFGFEVIDRFPQIAFDVTETGKCLSFGLWTAAVMHTMRVLEVGLKSLSAHLEVDHDSNWNTTLNKIEAKLREVRKNTDGSDAEQWAAEAGTHLRFIKNAWRNHAVHPLSTYDADRAKDIFRNSKSFMSHLAKHLSEA